jgi:hypothetical protein
MKRNRQWHVVIAMNRLMGLSLARHKKLKPESVIIVCSPDEAVVELAGIDIHDVTLHVSGDSHSIPMDTGTFNAVISTCTNH